MHELGIADSILQAVRAEMARQGPGRACKVAVRIGPMSGVDAGSLTFCFDALVKGSELEPLELEIVAAGGDELQLSYLELEDA